MMVTQLKVSGPDAGWWLTSSGGGAAVAGGGAVFGEVNGAFGECMVTCLSGVTKVPKVW